MVHVGDEHLHRGGRLLGPPQEQMVVGRLHVAVSKNHPKALTGQESAHVRGNEGLAGSTLT